jgi:hypothetical protein
MKSILKCNNQITLFILILCASQYINAHDIFISPLGDDTNDGTKMHPFKTVEKSLEELKKYVGTETVTVWFNQGDYYLENTIKLGSEYSGTKEYPVVFSALPGAEVNIKGSKKLENLDWKQYKNGIYVSQLPRDLNFDQLFVNEERQIRARFPNYDYDNPLRGAGTSYDEVVDGTDQRFDKWFSYNTETFTIKDWSNPATGIVHAFQSHNWGNMQYKIKNVDKLEHKIYLDKGGWQLQRIFGIGSKGSHASWFFIDNVFEELDVPGEWFFDKNTNLLYYYPFSDLDLNDAIIEVPLLKNLIELKGTIDNPVKYIHFKGFNFTQSQYTFMDDYEPLARGDWAIHRGGAVYFESVENSTIESCNFEYLGGNGVFMSGYNRNNMVSGCRFVHTGESAVCFVGLPSAVRFFQTWDDKEIYGKNWESMRKNMDLTAGPKTDDYPKNCVVENSIMHDFGDVGKQVAGVFISMSHKIKASHNTIYNCPRAGICINDGTWGGHVIEFNDIWETVRETGEHGPFNSWGRERHWKGSRGSDDHFIKELTKLDAIDNVIIRNNRIANYRKSISAGNWTIDLDDGSSYYEIYNNLSLGSTIKLRDGMARKVFNNITVSAVPLGWHVWPKDSEDEIYKNIFVISGAVPGKKEPTNRFIRDVGLPTETMWSKHYDNNFYWNINDPYNFDIIEGVNMEQWQQKGYDIHSLSGNPLFVDVENGNYQVKENSPAIKLGFQNFEMDSFGHEMTKVVPFGGEFEKSKVINIKADKSAGKNYKIYYTVDGTEPTINSLVYAEPFKIDTTTIIKAKTYNQENTSVGFTAIAAFNKVEKIVYPSWYSTLLAGEYLGEKFAEKNKAIELEIEGALLINIADDPDLIDATGGYNFGCYIKSIDNEKAKMWLDAKLPRDWVIQQVNGEKINDISDLQKAMKKYKNKKVVITAFRDYNSKKFKVKF